MYLCMVKQLCPYISSLCSLHKQLCLFIAAPVTSRVHVVRENHAAAIVQDLPAPPPVENFRNKKCHVSLDVSGHVAPQAISSSFIQLEAYFLTTAADIYKPRVFNVTCLPLFSLYLRNNSKNKNQMYILMLSPLLHQQDLRRRR